MSNRDLDRMKCWSAQAALELHGKEGAAEVAEYRLWYRTTACAQDELDRRAGRVPSSGVVFDFAGIEPPEVVFLFKMTKALAAKCRENGDNVGAIFLGELADLAEKETFSRRIDANRLEHLFDLDSGPGE